VEDGQNFNYASTELLLEASSKNSTISQEEDSQFFNSELILIDSVRNVFDEQEEHLSVVKNLFNGGPSDASLSDISVEEDLLSKSALSLDVECPQLQEKKSSEGSNLETEDILSQSSASNEILGKSVMHSLFTYDQSDKDLCYAFQSDYSTNSLTFRKNTSDIFSMSVADTPLRTRSEHICYDSCLTGGLTSPCTLAQNTAATDCKVKREILDHSDRRYTGVLKFYNENKGFGFVGCEQDSTEIFLHGDDLLKANIDIKNLKKKCVGGLMRFSFSILEYLGKYNRSRKVVDLKLIEFA
jgi:hypothetical protein